MAELGSDIAGVFDIGPTLGVSTGRPALAEAILRRLAQQRGTLLNAPTYGYDLHDTIGSFVIASRIEQKVLEQVRAEEEVERASVTVTFNQATGEVVVDISVRDGDGPFALTVKSDELRIQALLDGVLFADEESRGATTSGLILPGTSIAEDTVVDADDGDNLFPGIHAGDHILTDASGHIYTDGSGHIWTGS